MPGILLGHSITSSTLTTAEIAIARFPLGQLLLGNLTRVAAVGLLLLTTSGIQACGPLQAMEHAYPIGIAGFLNITGPGPGAVR